MPTSLQDRLTEARRRHFVGRQNERELFLAAVTAAEFPFNLLYLFGPGGHDPLHVHRAGLVHRPAFLRRSRAASASARVDQKSACSSIHCAAGVSPA